MMGQHSTPPKIDMEPAALRFACWYVFRSEAVACRCLCLVFRQTRVLTRPDFQRQPVRGAYLALQRHRRPQLEKFLPLFWARKSTCQGAKTGQGNNMK